MHSAGLDPTQGQWPIRRSSPRHNGSAAWSPSRPEGREDAGLADSAAWPNCQAAHSCRRVRSGSAIGASGAVAHQRQGRRKEHRDDKGSSSDAEGWTGAHRRDGATLAAEGRA
jgi:hypothetical protein